ncbi:MAG: HAD family phosphatase, partial [Cyanobacteria bacterium P01_A01_bin.15]
VFEDSPTGVQAGAGAGIATIGITSSHSDATLVGLGARFTVADFTDGRLLSYLDGFSAVVNPCLSGSA